MKILEQNFPSVKRILLLGGEPFLHPQLIDFVECINNIFKNNIEIRILTNGTIPLKDGQIESLSKIKKDNLNVVITPYPNNHSEKLEKQLKENEVTFLKNFERMYFNQTLVDQTGSQSRMIFHKCPKYRLPCFTLKDYKIYICPFSAHINVFCSAAGIQNFITDKDYLDIRNSTTQDLQDFCFITKNICKYCKPGTYQLYAKGYRDIQQFEWTNLDLFLNDYDTYNKVMNSKDIYDTYHKDKIDPAYGESYQDFLDIRFGKGLIDIIIPYYEVSKDQIIQQINNLKNQTIIDKCCIYLISDGSPNEKEVFEAFSNTNLNIVFLKNKNRGGPGAARNIGLKNSYNNYIFCLDFDDSFANSKILSKIYSDIVEKNLDFSIYKKAGLNIIIEKRSIIDNHSIFFSEDLIIHEDGLRFEQLFLYNLRYEDNSEKIVIYNRDNPHAISSNSRVFSLCCYHLLQVYFWLKNYNDINEKNKIKEDSFVLHYLNQNKKYFFSLGAELENFSRLPDNLQKKILKLGTELKNQTFDFEEIILSLKEDNFYESKLIECLRRISNGEI